MGRDERLTSTSSDESGEWLRNIEAALDPYVSPMAKHAIVSCAYRKCGSEPEHIRLDDLPQLFEELKRGVKLFVENADEAARCEASLNALAEELRPSTPPLFVRLNAGADVVKVSKALEEALADRGFSLAGQRKIVRVLTEMASDIVRQVGGGQMTIRRLSGQRMGIEVIARPDARDVTNSARPPARAEHGPGRSPVAPVDLRSVQAIADEFDVSAASEKNVVIKFRKFSG